MSAINLYTKDYNEIGFAEDLPRDGLTPLENKIKALFTNFEVNEKKLVTESVRLEKLVDNGILCSVRFIGESIPSIRFIPSRLFEGLDLDYPLHHSTFARRVDKEWRKVRWHGFTIHRPAFEPAETIVTDKSSAAQKINSQASQSAAPSRLSAIRTIKTKDTNDMPTLTEMVFAEPNTLIFRRRLPKLTDQEESSCSTYRKNEVKQWNDKLILEEFFDSETKAILSKEEKLLFRSQCFPSSSLEKEKWKLSQTGIENCFQFLPIIERVVYKTTEAKPLNIEMETTSEVAEVETHTIVREEFFCSYPV